MFNLKNIATAALIATASLCTLDAVSTIGAKAMTCMDFDAGSLCNDYQYSNRYGQVYNVGYVAHDGEFSAAVVCDGRNLVDWSGTKERLTESQVRYVVTEFCALPNG